MMALSEIKIRWDWLAKWLNGGWVVPALRNLPASAKGLDVAAFWLREHKALLRDFGIAA